MKSAMVTGGAGFIGSALCRALAARNWRVLCVDKLTYAGDPRTIAAELDAGHVRLETIDICDLLRVSQALADFKPDCVFHLAAETHVDRSISGPAAFIETNVTGTSNVLRAVQAYATTLSQPSAEAFRFLHVSTDEVFGSLGAEGLFCETTAYDPRSPYSASKAASDHLVRAWRHTYGLPTIVTNCSNNYGPYQFPEKLIPLMIVKGLAGEPLPVYGDGMNVRDWLHVTDHAEGLIAAMERGTVGETYLFGGRSERTNRQVVETLCDILDAVAPRAQGSRRDLITFVADRPGHDRRYAIDCSRAERELGWRQQHDFESGLRATVDWYMAHRDWWEPILSGVYRGDRLGLLPARASAANA